MNIDLVEELLNEEESATLDFKSEQYLFSKATDDEKGELLKDILAFANAWRRTDAYILVGVKDVKGSRSDVVGIISDLDDASIQQFVNHKTNRNIDFSYRAISIDGIKLGVFHIPIQEKRPFYLKKDFGKLKQKTVYIRRSSSTDVADLDEISTMGVSKLGIHQEQLIPKIDLQFFDNSEKLLLGNSLNITSKVLQYNEDEIVGKSYSPADSYLYISENKNFERDFARCMYNRSLVRPVCFNIINEGVTLAQNVIARISLIRGETPLVMYDEKNYPPMPSRNSIQNYIYKSALKNTSIERSKNLWKVTIKFGNIQPKESTHSDFLYIGSLAKCRLKLDVSVFADNLPNPLVFPMLINIKTEEGILDVKKLYQLK